VAADIGVPLGLQSRGDTGLGGNLSLTIWREGTGLIDGACRSAMLTIGDGEPMTLEPSIVAVEINEAID
jgi:hypothetical protein